MKKLISSFDYHPKSSNRKTPVKIIDFFKKINLNSTFIKLISSYLLLATIILSLSTVTLYITNKDKVLKQINSMSEKLLVQTNYLTDYLINWTTTAGYSVYRDTDVFHLMYGKDLSYTEEVVGKNKLKHAISSIPLAHSIYIYNSFTGKIFSSISDSMDISVFYDTEIITMLKNRQKYLDAKLIPRKLSFTVEGINYKNNVLTLIISDYPISNGLNSGALILNLYATEVQNVLKDIKIDNSDVFIVDKTGNIISHSDSNKIMTNISHEEYMKKILSTTDRSGYFVYTINGKKSLITYDTSPKYNIKFISIIPYDDLLSDVKAMTKLSIYIFIVLMIMGITLAYFFSRRIYLPIGEITRNVQQYFTKQKKLINTTKVNELDFLSNALDKLLHDPLSLKDLSQVDINFVKHQLLKGLLLNQSNHIKDLNIKFSELNININPEYVTIYVLRIDYFKEFHSKYSRENQDLLRFAIGNIAFDMTSRHFICDTVDMGDSHIAVMLNIDKNRAADDISLLVKCIEDIQQAVHHYLEISITAGICNCITNLTDVSLSYRTAYDYTNYRFKYGPESILYNDKIMENINEDYHYPADKEASIFNALKLGHANDVETALSEMLDEIKQYSYNDMLLTITQLTINSKQLLKTTYGIGNEDSYFIDIRYFRKNLEKFENVNEVKQWLLTLYTDAIQQRERKKSTRKEDIANSVISYIEFNYSDPMLSPELIADYVNISPNYLRSIFKEVKNGSLSAYINEYRLQKAKELLETTNLPVSEISDSVGFTNNTYFYTAFKKFFGTTPNEYRKLGFFNK